MSAAMTVSRVSPISPNSLCSFAIRWSRSLARRRRWASWPASHCMRNCRPLIVTITCDIAGPAGSLGCSAVMGLQHRADRVDGSVQPPRNFPVRVLKRALSRYRGIEIAGEPGLVVAQRVDLRGQIVLAEIDLATPLGRGFERVERA